MNRIGRVLILGPLLVVAALIGCAVTHPPEIGSAQSVMPPCFVPRNVDTTGWQTARMFSLPVAFRLPAGFKRVSSGGAHGGFGWRNGARSFSQSNGVWGEHSFGSPDSNFPGYSECIDSLAGFPFRIIASYDRRRARYWLVAVPIGHRDLLGYSEALRWMSPDSTDQRLFLAIIRTLRPDSTNRSEAPLKSGGK